MDFVMSSRMSNLTLGTAPILVIGLFSGIGGTFRVYHLLDVIPRASIGVDIHAPANRAVGRRWPGVTILRDVKHLWGGFPCRDLCGAGAHRRNLEGSESSLFFEFLRLKNMGIIGG